MSWERGRGDLKEEKNETIDFRRDEVLKRLRYERYKRNRDTASNAVRPPPPPCLRSSRGYGRRRLIGSRVRGAPLLIIGFLSNGPGNAVGHSPGTRVTHLHALL